MNSVAVPVSTLGDCITVAAAPSLCHAYTASLVNTSSPRTWYAKSLRTLTICGW